MGTQAALGERSAEGGGAMGQPIASFGYDPDQRRVSLIVGLGLVAIAIAIPVLYYLDPVAVGRVPLFTVIPFAILVAIGAFLHVGYAGTVRLDVHERGFAYKGTAVPFERVRGIRYKLVQVIGGAASYNRGFFEIRLDDGSKIRPSMQLERMDEAIGAIEAGSQQTLVGGMGAALRGGSAVRLGPFELRREGVVCKGESIPWARVAFSSTNEEMKLMDVDPEEGDYRDVHECKHSDVECARALEELAESLRVEAIRRAS